MIRRWKASSELAVISGKITEDAEPIVFAVVRNEMLRLPAFLNHYRKLGIQQFVLVENNSTDATREFLAAQSDVLLYMTRAHFYRKESWLDYLLHRHGAGRWCMVVDADELLLYPASGILPIPDFCRYLEQEGANALHAILLDLYPKEPVAEVVYVSGSDYFHMPWYFDSMKSLAKVPRAFYRGSGLEYRFEGGVRKRTFDVSACCSKFPLFRFVPGMFLSDGQHYIEHARIAELRAVLCHFKYLQDFEVHVREEVSREQHWQGGSEYKAYAKTVSKTEGSLQIWNEESILLQGVEQLEQLGFTSRPFTYQRFLQSKEH